MMTDTLCEHYDEHEWQDEEVTEDGTTRHFYCHKCGREWSFEVCTRCGCEFENESPAVRIDDTRGVQTFGIEPTDLSGGLCTDCANDHDADIKAALYSR